MAAMVDKASWMDAILTAAKTGDENTLVMELAKIPEMLGRLWLGMNTASVPPYPGGAVPSHAKDSKTKDEDPMGSGMHIHVHNPETKDDDDDKNSDMMSRLESVERAIAILAKGDEPEKGKDKKSKDMMMKDEKEDDDDDDKKMMKMKDKKSKDMMMEDEKEDDDDDWKKKETKDSRANVGDSRALVMPWQEVISRSEFLAPGIKQPTFDAAAPAKLTMDNMCKFRRKVLDEAMKEDDTRAAIEQMVGSKPKLAQMTCDSVALIYNGASELMRQHNNKVTTQPSGKFDYFTSGNTDLASMVKDINSRNRTRYGIKA